nr:hypothetical protein [uncultured Acetatifactor sp.]
MPPALPGGCQGQTAVARKGRGLLNRADARGRQPWAGRGKENRRSVRKPRDRRTSKIDACKPGGWELTG